jgi:SAM-dependent methyltransferase
MPEMCHLCQTGSLRLFPAFAELNRVSSDAKPFPAGGELGVCLECGAVQKPMTAKWQAEAEAIYAAYTIYHNAGGAEQKTFTGGGGQPQARSSRLVQQVRDRVGLPNAGRMLDVGCGNGAMLRSFSELMPGWALAGNELGDRNRGAIEAIPRVEKLYTGAPDTVPGAFDAITLLHVLEHVPDPVAFLRRLVPKLSPGGLLIVEVPDYRHSAIDLAVADHCTHFSPEVLAAVFEAAGLEVVAAAEDFIPKELTVVGRPGASPTTIRPGRTSREAIRCVDQQIEWLIALAGHGRDLAAASRVGVFGTSLGGAWLLGELGAAVAFFVDEDPAKVGKTWAGRPILHPRDVPSDAAVLIGLPSAIAGGVKARLDSVPGRYHVPRAA